MCDERAADRTATLVGDRRFARRPFALRVSDIGAGELLPQPIAAVAARAPGVRLEAVQMHPAPIGPALEDGRERPARRRVTPPPRPTAASS